MFHGGVDQLGHEGEGQCFVHREWTSRPGLTSPGLTSRSGLTSLLLTNLLLTSPVLVEVQSLKEELAGAQRR